MKPVVFSRHARWQMVERVVSEQEVVETIQHAPWEPARQGRLRATRWYPFGQEHRGVIYKGKDVRPVFVEEPDRIVVVTGYVYLNQWEESR